MNLDQVRAIATRQAAEGSEYAAKILELLDDSDDQKATMEQVAAATIELVDHVRRIDRYDNDDA